MARLNKMRTTVNRGWQNFEMCDSFSFHSFFTHQSSVEFFAIGGGNRLSLRVVEKYRMRRIKDCTGPGQRDGGRIEECVAEEVSAALHPVDSLMGPRSVASLALSIDNTEG